MYVKKIIAIGILILTICLSITAISAVENITELETDNIDIISINDNESESAINNNDLLTTDSSDDNDVLSDSDSMKYVATNFRNLSDMRVNDNATCIFSESDLDAAKNNYMGVTKTVKNVGVIQVKELKQVSKKVKTYKTVKVTKKFTVGKLVNGRLKMDLKKFNKLTKKYKKHGYKVTDKWSGKKRVLIATKKVKKFKSYKTQKVWKKTGNWITLTDVKYQLLYSEGGMVAKGYYVSVSPIKSPYTGKEYYSNGDLFKESYDRYYGKIWTLVSAY